MFGEAGYTLGVVILILLIVVFLWNVRSQESEQFDVAQDLGLDANSSLVMNAPGMPIDVGVIAMEDRPYMRLYEDYKKQNLAYEFLPRSGHGAHRQFMKINLKHIDAYLPRTNSGPYANIRGMQIYSVYGGAPNASMLSSFYNPYLEPTFEFTANTAKYRQLLDLKPGQRASIDVTDPTHQIAILVLA